MKTPMLRARTLLLAGAALAACGPKSQTPITPTLPGDGDSNVAKPPAEGSAPVNDPWAGRTDLIQAPPAKAPQKVDLPPIERFTLANGLRVFVIKNGRLPVVSMQLAVQAGRADEPRAKVGVSELTAKMLIKGTRGKNALAIAKAIDDVGGRLSSDASYEASIVDCNVVSKDLKTCLALVPAVLTTPTFPADEMPKVKDELLAEIRQRLDDAAQMASAQLQNLLWGNDHVRGWVTSAEGLNAITRDDLVAWHKNHFSPDHALLAVVGDVDPVRLKRDLERAFAPWKKAKVLDRPTYPDPKLTGVKIRLVDKPRQSQTHIRVGQLGIRHDDPRFFDTLVWNYVLGGGAFSSRLMRVVRSEGGKTYGASSTFDRNLDRGSIVAGSFTRNAEAVATTKLILAEIAKMQKDGPTDAEVADAIANIAGSYAVRFESASDVASSLLAAELHGFGEEYLENFPLRVAKVDVASAKAAAHDVLDPANYVITLVGDAKDLEPQLKSEGWRYEKVPFTAPISPLPALPPAPIDPAAEKAGRAVLDAALTAKGGQVKLAALKTLRMAAKGKMINQGVGFDIEVTRQLALPDEMRVDLIVHPPGAKAPVNISYAYDGKQGWQKAPDGAVGDIEASQLPSLARQRWLEPELILLRPREKGAKVKALPDETIDGVAYDAVNVTSSDGQHTVTLYIDKKTHLVHRMAYPEEGGVTLDTFADYKPINGIQVAHKRTSTSAGGAAQQSVELELVKAEINPKLDAGAFARPAQ